MTTQQQQNLRGWITTLLLIAGVIWSAARISFAVDELHTVIPQIQANSRANRDSALVNRAAINLLFDHDAHMQKEVDRLTAKVHP